MQNPWWKNFGDRFQIWLGLRKNTASCDLDHCPAPSIESESHRYFRTSLARRRFSMSALPLSKVENISNLLNMNEEYAAPAIVANNVLQNNWKEECQRALEDPDRFWSEYAHSFVWSQPWNKVLDWDGVHHKWFTGAKTNITINALDRHANSERRNRAAFIWLGEDGAERIVTYGQLYRQVCRFATGSNPSVSSKATASSSTCR
jgi:hypothetical protein